jgi:predicted branched-subunit amino acid permease
MSALGLAIYGMFVAIVVPDMKKVRPVIIIVIIAAAISTCFTYIPVIKEISPGIAISISAVVAAVIGAVFFPVKDENISKASPAVSEGGAE